MLTLCMDAQPLDLWENKFLLLKSPIALHFVLAVLDDQYIVRKHLTGAFLCAVLDLSGNFGPY